MNSPTHSQTETVDRYDSEINLAELITILLNHKSLIVGIPFFCALLAALITSLQPRQYESEVLILVSPSIVKPNNKSNEGTQLSEVTVSSLEASTYEVLAKSDELMLALADTLKTKLLPEELKSISEETNTYGIAISLTNDLEIELLQDSDRRGPPTNPILVLSYQSSEESLPAVVVNTWSKLFIQRNIGLSSNVTDDFYQSVVSQYDQAKENLERREDDLVKLDRVTSELNLVKTTVGFKNTRLDATLNKYSQLQTELNQKKREYNFVVKSLREIQTDNGEWVGYNPKSASNLEQKQAIIPQLFDRIDRLTKDSLSTRIKYRGIYDMLNLEQLQESYNFEKKTKIYFKRLEAKQIEKDIRRFNEELVIINTVIDSLEMEASIAEQLLDKESPVLTTRKAIADESLWNLTNSDGEIEAEKQREIGNYRLISEEINPIHQNIRQLLTKINIQLGNKKKRSIYLSQQVDSLSNTYSNINSLLHKLSSAEFDLITKQNIEKKKITNEEELTFSQIKTKLSTARKAYEGYKDQYDKLSEQRHTLFRELQELNSLSQYHAENYSIWREQLLTLSAQVDSLELERKRTERDVTVYKESFERFAKLKEEARIARQQAAGDIQIVSDAQLSNARPKNTVKITIYTGIIVFILLLIAVLTKELILRYNAASSTSR